MRALRTVAAARLCEALRAATIAPGRECCAPARDLFARSILTGSLQAFSSFVAQRPAPGAGVSSRIADRAKPPRATRPARGPRFAGLSSSIPLRGYAGIEERPKNGPPSRHAARPADRARRRGRRAKRPSYKGFRRIRVLAPLAKRPKLRDSCFAERFCKSRPSRKRPSRKDLRRIA
jgi:hypothetical protein